MGSQIKQRSVLFGPFKYFTSSRQKHLANCRLYSESGSEKSETLVFPTLPFLAGTVELYSSSYHSQRLGRFSVTYHPTVHRTTSPAFELFRVGGLARLDPVFPIMHNAGGGRLVGMPGAIKLPSFDGLHVLLQHLPAKLEELFKSGEARPHERDEFGHTLMFVG